MTETGDAALHAEAAIEYLKEQALGSAILVEGQKDMAALQSLGVQGTHIVLNEGVGVVTKADRIIARAQAEGWRQIVILMDWDRTGDRLQRRLELNFAGRLVTNGEARRRLMGAFDCKCIEHVPSELAALAGS